VIGVRATGTVFCNTIRDTCFISLLRPRAAYPRRLASYILLPSSPLILLLLLHPYVTTVSNFDSIPAYQLPERTAPEILRSCGCTAKSHDSEGRAPAQVSARRTTATAAAARAVATFPRPSTLAPQIRRRPRIPWEIRAASFLGSNRLTEVASTYEEGYPARRHARGERAPRLPPPPLSPTHVPPQHPANPFPKIR
jgi:hypothetical protein